MKKALSVCAVIATLLVSHNALADEKESKAKQPKLVLQVLDTSNKLGRDTGKKIYSVSNKNLVLCWTAFDMEFMMGNNNTVIETFTPPADSTIMKPNATVRKVDNSIIITSKAVAKDNGKVVQECWQLDETDPLGKYHLTVQVNDIVFQGLSFDVVK